MKYSNSDAYIKYKRDYSQFNYDSLEKNIYNYYVNLCDNNIEYENGSAEVKIRLVTDVIVNSIDSVAPIKEYVIKNKWQNSRWFNSRIKNLISMRDDSYRVLKKKKNCNVEWEKYRRLRNTVVNEIRKMKREYFKKLIDSEKGNLKKLWKKMKSILGNKSQEEKKLEIVFNNELIKKNTLIADKFNNYFVRCVEDIVNEIDKFNCNVNEFRYDKSVTRLDKLIKVDETELNSIIKNLDKTKGKGNVISYDMISKIWSVNKVVITQLINCSLESAEIPIEWKNSVIHPIPKVKGTNKAEEYRPINTLPELEKILEEVVEKRLTEYLDKNNILSEEQSGFRVNYSCETTLQKTMCEWRNEIDKGNLIGVVFIDFKRAFETIDRQRLIKKLEMYGVGGSALEWFKCYLSKRTQQVKYGNAISDKIDVNHGVPQGSILGPLLFILYINDIVDIANKHECKCKLFADDKMLYYSTKDEKEIVNALNKTLEGLGVWLNVNSLKPNVKKTVFMLIRDKRKKNNKNIELLLAGEKIMQCSETKDLGIMLDESLSFYSHTYYIIKKINARINLMYRLSSYISDYTKVLIYKSMIAPYFEYCSTLLVNINEECVNKLQKCQNKAMRIILRVNRYTPIRCMLDALCFLSVRERIKFNVSVFIYKMKNNLLPDYLNRIIVKSDHNYSTRNRNRLLVQKSRTIAGGKTIDEFGFFLYN